LETFGLRDTLLGTFWEPQSKIWSNKNKVLRNKLPSAGLKRNLKGIAQRREPITKVKVGINGPAWFSCQNKGLRIKPSPKNLKVANQIMGKTHGKSNWARKNSK